MKTRKISLPTIATPITKEFNVTKNLIKWIYAFLGVNDTVQLENYLTNNYKIDNLIDIASKKTPHHTSKIKRFNARFYKEQEQFIVHYWN